MNILNFRIFRTLKFGIFPFFKLFFLNFKSPFSPHWSHYSTIKQVKPWGQQNIMATFTKHTWFYRKKTLRGPILQWNEELSLPLWTPLGVLPLWTPLKVQISYFQMLAGMYYHLKESIYMYLYYCYYNHFPEEETWYI